ncbi:hypothetical protein [Streptomyces sp. NPDC018000]|uniref:hypothetical protein n=1 Tax=Streptomyces sp. NPDC018000 TaxID=3365028 RepID=UPI0037A067B5
MHSRIRRSHGRTRARLAVGAALLLVAEVTFAAGTASASTPPPAKESSEAKSSSSEPAKAAKHPKGSKGWAISEAKKTGEKVVATDETTATSYTVANADGTLTTELTSGPERV